jgi:hypothetical protein
MAQWDMKKGVVFMKTRIANGLGVLSTLLLLTNCSSGYKAESSNGSESALDYGISATTTPAAPPKKKPKQKPTISNPEEPTPTPTTPSVDWTSETPFSKVAEMLPDLARNAELFQIGDINVGSLLSDKNQDVVVTEPDLGRVIVFGGCPDCKLLAVFDGLAHPVSAAIGPCGTTRTNGVLIADRGSLSGDFPDGKIICMEQYQQGKFSPKVLADKLNNLSALKMADFNGDGCPDLVATTAHTLEWYKNDCSGNYTENAIENDSDATFIDTGDLNNDSYTDFVTMSADGKVDRFLNTGNGNFYKDTVFPGKDRCSGPSSVKIYDPYGDGRKAILKTNGLIFDQTDNLTDWGLRVARNSPWSFPGLAQSDCNPFDAERRHGLYIFESDGHNGFNKERKLADLYGASSIALLDLNGDKHTDIVAGGSRNPKADPTDINPHTLVWLNNAGDGKFEPQMLGWPGSSAYQVVPAYFHGLDYPSLLISSYEGSHHDNNNCYLGHFSLKGSY